MHRPSEKYQESDVRSAVGTLECTSGLETFMISRFGRAACVFLGIVILVGGSSPHTANALDTPNVLMGIDGMVMHASGLFRAPGSIPGAVSDDGSNTFVFFNFAQRCPVGRAVPSNGGRVIGPPPHARQTTSPARPPAPPATRGPPEKPVVIARGDIFR